MVKAYGYFDCKKPQIEIQRELANIRDAVGTPSKLELSLTSTKDFTGDSNIAKRAEELGTEHIIEATHRGTSNESTARELSAIMNQKYQSKLYKEGDLFDGSPYKGQIAYKKAGSFILQN